MPPITGPKLITCVALLFSLVLDGRFAVQIDSAIMGVCLIVVRIVSILIASMLFIGGWVVFGRENIPQSFEQEIRIAEEFTAEIDTSNWVTYRNEELGFEVKHPEGWRVLIDPYMDPNTGHVSSVSINVEKESVEGEPYMWWHVMKYIDGKSSEEIIEEVKSHFRQIADSFDVLSYDFEVRKVEWREQKARLLEMKEISSVKQTEIQNKIYYIADDKKDVWSLPLSVLEGDESIDRQRNKLYQGFLNTFKYIESRN